MAESDQDDARALELLGRHAKNAANDDELDELRRFSSDIRARHRLAATEVVGAVRWLTRRDAAGAAVRDLTRASWSEDGSAWQPLPLGDPPLADTGWGPFDIDDDTHTYFAQTIQERVGEPLAHEMLQEARGQLEINPRSCLVIAVAALEVGVKQHVTRMGGTYGERATVQRLLNRVVPALRSDRWRRIAPWLNVRLQAGVTARNRLVHQGAAPPNREELRLLLRGIRDVLYLLDWQYGYEWALTFVSFLQGDLDLVGPEPEFRIVLPPG